MSKCDLYFLRDPRSMVIRYIGISTHVESRLAWHCNKQNAKYHDERKSAWLQELAATGLEPIMDIILHGLESHVAIVVERRLILLHSQVYGTRMVQQSINVRRKSDGTIGALGDSRKLPRFKLPSEKRLQNTRFFVCRNCFEKYFEKCVDTA